MNTTEELRNNSSFDLERRAYGRGDPLRWPRGNLCHKFCTVVKVRSWTQVTELSLVLSKDKLWPDSWELLRAAYYSIVLLAHNTIQTRGLNVLRYLHRGYVSDGFGDFGQLATPQCSLAERERKSVQRDSSAGSNKVEWEVVRLW
jgi:hypothetical protein